MTWIDAAVLVIVVLSAAFSMVRGFVREVLGVGAWIGASLAAVKFYPLVLPEVSSVLPSTPVTSGLVGSRKFVRQTMQKALPRSI